MDFIDELKKHGVFAHAYLLRTGAEHASEDVREMLLEKVSPLDIYIESCESLSVSGARTIVRYASLKPVSGTRKYIVVAAGSMTTEAQNALLKAVEEGMGHTSFFFIIAPGVPVVPTLSSRCITIQSTGGGQATQEGEAFLNLSYKERLARAEKFAKNHDREGARALVRSLLALAASRHGRRGALAMPAGALRDLLEADQYLALSGSSPKGVIGHLALVL